MTTEQRNEQDEANELYRAYVEDITKSQLSNSEAFDKAILTLSSASLALSLSFFKFVIPVEKAVNLNILEIALMSFLVAIISTILSQRISQISLNVSLKHAEKYYLEGLEEYANKNNAPANVTELLNWVSGISFVIAVTSVVYFVTENI